MSQLYICQLILNKYQKSASVKGFFIDGTVGWFCRWGQTGQTRVGERRAEGAAGQNEADPGRDSRPVDDCQPEEEASGEGYLQAVAQDAWHTQASKAQPRWIGQTCDLDIWNF